MLALSLALLALLIGLNALYVGAEFAAVSVRRSRLHARAAEGDRLAKMALAQIEPAERLDDFVAACQVGITISSLALGAVGQAQLAPVAVGWFEAWGGLDVAAGHSTAAAVVLVVLTVLQMILGELVPKSLALHAPIQAVRWTALPMRWSRRLLSGFVAVLNGSGRLILRAFGQPAVGHAHVHSPEELELLVAESGEQGVLGEGASRRLRRALGLRRRRARQLMTPRPRVQALDADLPAGEIVRAVLGGSYTRYPVYRGHPENVIGILHSRDLAPQVLAGRPLDVESLLRPAVAVPGTMPSDQLLRTMRHHRALQLVVIDEFGGLAGIVSASDLLRDVLGKVPEDFAGAPATPERLADGRARLPGRLPLDRAAHWTGREWPSGAETVAGAVLEAAGGLPEPGSRVRVAGMELEVERVEDHAVVSVLAPAPGGDGDG